MSGPVRRVITSPGNPTVKAVVTLRKPRARAEAGVALVDGYAELQLAIAAGVRPSTVFVCEQFIRDPTQLRLLEQPPVEGAEIVQLSRAAFAKASVRESPDGWLAIVPAPERQLDEIALCAESLVLVCDGVEKPGNLGAMLRTAEAVGVAAVVAASPATDWGNPNVVRASKGTVFAVPVASASAHTVRKWLIDHGVAIVVADPIADATVRDANLGRRPLAIVVGSEHSGADPVWLAGGALAVALPMIGHVNSLNVSAVTAVLLYDAIIQSPKARNL
jgi:RNA methyltransferase, TrmH family